jgi:hypothetical protein
VRKFGLSLPQATNDLVTYATLSEGGCIYNNRKRRYETAPGFHPRLVLPRLWEDLQMLSRVVWSAEGTPLLAVPELPVRQASPGVAQQISRAIFSSQAVEIRYWSARSGGEESRTISPRAFGDDGLRVHVRAYCHRSREFKDFNLSRIEEVLSSGPCPFRDEVDTDWQRFVQVELAVNRELEPVHQAALQRDYRMTDGRLAFTVRKALLFYTLRRLGFSEPISKSPPYPNELRELILERVTELP